ncbi:putative thioredoxin [Cardiosporidium cionae]|uniref:Thioredoxin n=1 Tax=Cardiosporidium cionae TaxID=476202 RepID=A0ABQ7JCR8_9APIC|nr:putative thioredoxin [Cardiosporidium cionae]|eukprot:KAF8821817.1 putative thioredoxin [Cardiosporidium cionae]
MPVKTIASQDEFMRMKNNGVVSLVDFFAEWCGPCKMMAPYLLELSEQSDFKDIAFFKVDVDQVPELCAVEDIEGMPTFKIYKNGQSVETIVGANKGVLVGALKRYAK